MSRRRHVSIPIVIALGLCFAGACIDGAIAWEFQLTAEPAERSDRLERFFENPRRAERQAAQSYQELSGIASLRLVPKIRVSDGFHFQGAYEIPTPESREMSYGPYLSASSEDFGHRDDVKTEAVEGWRSGGRNWGGTATRGGRSAAPDSIAAVVQAPMGMVSVGEYEYPFRPYGKVSRTSSCDEAFLTLPAGPLRFAYTTRIVRPAPGDDISGRRNVAWDLLSLHAAGISYRWGNLGLGGLAMWRETRNDSDPSRGGNEFGDGRGPAAQNTWINMLFLKLDNGSVFFGGELAWARSYLSPRAGRPGIAVGSHQRSARTWLAEAGVELGPTRLSLLYAGVRGRLGYGLDPVVSYLPQTTSISDPRDLTGELPDVLGAKRQTPAARLLSGRLWTLPEAYRIACHADHSLAANLHMWTQIVFAAGSPPTPSSSDGVIPSLDHLASDTGRRGSTGASMLNHQSHSYLHSWEFNAGLNWNLMKGMSMAMRYALYRPIDADELTQAVRAPDAAAPDILPPQFVNYLQCDLALRF